MPDSAKESQKSHPTQIRPHDLVQPCGLERLVDVAPVAPHGLGDLSGAHSFFAQQSKLVRLHFCFNNRRGTIDVNASDAVDESSLFVN
jgi:hypothetical protein